MNHAAAALALTEGQRLALEIIAKSTTAPHREVVRARVLLLAADGVANTRIAEQAGVSVTTVLGWRERFAAEGLTGKAIRRGVFKSVPDLVAAIEEYLSAGNDDPEPFVWTRTPPPSSAKRFDDAGGSGKPRIGQDRFVVRPGPAGDQQAAVRRGPVPVVHRRPGE